MHEKMLLHFNKYIFKKNPQGLSLFFSPESISTSLTIVSGPKLKLCSLKIENSSLTCSTEFFGRMTSTSPGCHFMLSHLKLINLTSWK